MASTTNPTNTISFLSPDLQAQQMQLQRQQALAQQMMQDSSQPINPLRSSGKYIVPISPLEGLTHMGSMWASALMNKNLDQKQLDLSRQQYARMAGLFGASAPSQPLPQQSAAPNNNWVNPDTGQVAPGQQQGQQDSGGQPAAGQASVPGAAPQQEMQGQGAPQGNGGLLTLPGTTPQQSMMLYMMAPDKYMEARLKANELTPEMKNVNAVYGANSPQGRQVMAAILNKSSTIEMRPGGMAMGPNGTVYAPQNGIQTVQGPNGPVAGAIPGYAAALQGNSAADAAGKAQYQPMQGFDQNGAPAWNTKYNIAQQVGGGARPAPGAQAPSASGSAMPGQENIPTGGTVAPNLPAAPVTPVATRPALAPGEVEAKQGEAKAAVDRDSLLRQQVQGSNERMNAIDNMIDLSKTNTKFGPGAGAKTFWEGVANQVPGIDVGKSDIENYQIFKKFSSNLASQYQKALGGTGTDAQLQNTLDSVTSPEQLNQVIPKVGNYLKSLEATTQININARDKALTDNANYPGTDAQKLIKVEGELRNNLDPRIVQMQMMQPQAAAAYYASLPPDQQAALKNKIQFVHQRGWIQ